MTQGSLFTERYSPNKQRLVFAELNPKKLRLVFAESL
jgi:hypothetical protein